MRVASESAASAPAPRLFQLGEGGSGAERTPRALVTPGTPGPACLSPVRTASNQPTAPQAA